MSPAAARGLAGEFAWDRLLPSWPWLLALAMFGRLLADRFALLHDPDTYLHIAAGNWMLAHRALPLHDPFSHSLPGAPWLATEWLAEIALAAVYDGFGWSGVVLLAAGCIALAVGLLAHFLLRRLEPLPALIAAAAAVALLLPHALARPHALALPLLVLWSGLLLAARDAGRPPPFAALPVMLLWANLHGSFMFGLALAAFAAGEAALQPAAGQTRRSEAVRWGLFVLAALVLALLTPFGPAGLLQPIRLSAMPALQASFDEWLSPDFHKMPALELWLLGLLLLGFGSGARLPWTRLVLLLGLVHMTLQHSRHADLLALVGPLALAAPLGRHFAALTMTTEAPSRLAFWIGRLARPPGLPALMTGIALFAAIALPLIVHPVARADDAATPRTAVDAAERLGLAGPLFNSEAFGGYLIWRGVPVFIDGRIEMYGNDFLARDYRAEGGDEAALREILAQYRIGWTLLAPDSGAAAVMKRVPGWERVYADRYAVVDRHIAAPR